MKLEIFHTEITHSKDFPKVIFTLIHIVRRVQMKIKPQYTRKVNTATLKYLPNFLKTDITMAGEVPSFNGNKMCN